jgi:hypothetical protein
MSGCRRWRTQKTINQQLAYLYLSGQSRTRELGVLLVFGLTVSGRARDRLGRHGASAISKLLIDI